MAELENVEGFDKACVVQVSVSIWEGKKKLPKDVLERMVEKNPDAAEYLTGRKSIVDPAEIKKIVKVRSKVTNYLDPRRPDSPVFQHPIKSLKIIPFELMEATDQRLRQYSAELDELADNFCDNIEEFKSFAHSALNGDGLFSELDYPLDLRKKFGVTWRFLTLSTVPEKLSMISPDMYQEQVNMLSETMQQVRQDAIGALRETFAGMVNNIIDRFTKKTVDGELKNKVFQNGTVNNFYDYFEQFKQRNIFDDSDLAELVEKAQGVLRGKSPEELRQSDSMKDLIRHNMLPLQKQLDELTKKPRRKIDLD